MKKLFAVILALSMILALAACSGGNKEPETTAAETETASTEEATSQEDTTAAPAESETTTAETSETETTEAEETTTEKEEKKVPETKEEILAEYTKVLDQAKKDKPAFKKVEYQELPSDSNSRVISQGATLVNAALKLADNFMTTEADAKADPEVKGKGSDMHSWPVYDNDTKGCMLTDASFIKSAKCEVLPNGNYRITMVLNDERNPEPPKNAKVSPSKTGAVVGTISKADIDKELNGGLVSAVFSNITYSLLYHDCQTVVEYNPETLEVKGIEQTTHVSISGSAKPKLGSALIIDRQELINHMKIYDIAY